MYSLSLSHTHTFIVEMWQHDTQRIQGLGNYNVKSLISAKNPRQRRGQGRVACIVKMEIANVSIVIVIYMAQNRNTQCYIPHQDSNFYCMFR